MCDSNKVRRNKAGVPIEADVSAHLAHPNLVRTIDTATAYREPLQKLDWEVKQDEAAEGTSPASQQSSKEESPTASSIKSPAKSKSYDAAIEETWLLLEYCDQGSFVVNFPGISRRRLPSALQCRLSYSATSALRTDRPYNCPIAPKINCYMLDAHSMGATIQVQVDHHAGHHRTRHAIARLARTHLSGGTLWHAGCCGGRVVPDDARWAAKSGAGAVHCR